MHTQNTRRARLVTGALMALTLTMTAAACGGESDAETADGKIKLTVATFNEFGYEELIEEYNAMQDEVVVEQKKAGTANEHQDNLYTKLAAGSGLSDIEAIEVDWLAALMQESDAFVDLSDADVEGRWLDWKTEAATTDDGALIGYGTDIGPEGICYRSDLFEKAGLPTDREEVASCSAPGTTTSPRRATSREGDPRHRVVRRLRRDRPGHDQPDRVLLRGRRRQRHRRATTPR